MLMCPAGFVPELFGPSSQRVGSETDVEWLTVILCTVELVYYVVGTRIRPVSGPVPGDFYHSTTGSVPVPVKSKLLIPFPVKILIPVVSRFQGKVVHYKSLDILCDLLSGNFNPVRCGKIRATDPRMGGECIYLSPLEEVGKMHGEYPMFHGRDIK